MIEPNISLF